MVNRRNEGSSSSEGAAVSAADCGLLLQRHVEYDDKSGF